MRCEVILPRNKIKGEIYDCYFYRSLSSDYICQQFPCGIWRNGVKRSTIYENLSCKTYSKDCLLKSKREDRIYNCQDSSDRIICQSKKPVFNYFIVFVFVYLIFSFSFSISILLPIVSLLVCPSFLNSHLPNKVVCKVSSHFICLTLPLLFLFTSCRFGCVS